MKIVQIIPGGDFFVVYKKTEEDPRDRDSWMRWASPVVAWGILENGKVVALDAGLNGEASEAALNPEFEGVYSKQAVVKRFGTGLRMKGEG